jgi:hypothetical protein
MSNIYTFSQDNIINNINLNNMTGGLGYKNVYDMIKESVYTDETHTKSFYNPDEREKTCKDTKLTLRCDSGKLLKYLIRIELKNYEKAKKNAKSGEIIKKEDYLRIIRPVKLNELNDIDKEEKGEIEQRLNTLDYTKEKCNLEYDNKIKEINANITLSKTQKENRMVEARAEKARCLALASSGPMFFKDKKIKKLETKKEELSQKYIINIGYLKNYFKLIRENIQKLVDLLNSCPFLVNVDQEEIAKALMSVIYPIIIEEYRKKTSRTQDEEKILQNLEASIDTIKLKAEERKIKDQQSNFIVRKIKKATSASEKAIFKRQNAIAAVGVTIGIGLIWFLIASAGAMTLALPKVAAVVLGILGIIGGIWGIRKLYRYIKFGSNTIKKETFVRNVSMFALNVKSDQSTSANPYGENSILKKLEDDLDSYVFKINQEAITNKSKCVALTSNPNECIIDIQDLCFTSVDEDCPAENERIIINGQIQEFKEKIYDKETEKFIEIDSGTKGVSGIIFGIGKSASEKELLVQRKIYQTQINNKKKITKILFEKMGEIFESLGNMADVGPQDIEAMNAEINSEGIETEGDLLNNLIPP